MDLLDQTDLSTAPDICWPPVSEYGRDIASLGGEPWTPEPVLKTKKIRVSRKGVKAGPHAPIIIGEWFGPLQVTGRAPNDGKERCVYIDCSLCGGKGKCRFRELRNGVVKSCGCLERAADAKYQAEIDNEIYHLETRDRNAIFTDIVQLKTK